MAHKDYPQAASNNAKRALKYAEDEGWGSCGTPVGKQRASDLAARRSLSDDVVVRVYSFLSRHAKNADVPYGEGCGGLMYDAWGGKAMLPWARKKVNEMNERNETPTHVVRALRNVVRDHNQRHPKRKLTAPAAIYRYNNSCGEERERFAQVREWMADHAGVNQRRRSVDSVYRKAPMDAGEAMELEGYAALFNSVTDLGAFREMIAPGAFDEVLDDDVRLLLNHDGAPLARTKNGTLQLSVDERGLHYRAQLSDTQAGRDLYTMVKRGDISQSSFGFTIKEQDIESDGLRVIRKIGRLLDVSPVSYPAYEDTEVNARAEGAN